MDLVFDEDVKAVAEFMQERLSANRLVSVANGLAAIAPLLWGRYDAEPVSVLQLVSPPPVNLDRDQRTQPGASGSAPDRARADDDFEAEVA